MARSSHHADAMRALGIAAGQQDRELPPLELPRDAAKLLRPPTSDVRCFNSVAKM